MFDLFRSREKSVRILLGVLLGLVALSMLIYLIPGGPGGGAGAAGQNTVAVVGDDQITTQDLQRAMARITRGQANLPKGLLGMYLPTVVNQLVEMKAMAYKARQMGLRVSDEELGNTIQAEFASELGGKFDMSVYQSVLEQQGMTVPDYEKERRDAMLGMRLENLEAQSLVVSDQDARAEYQRKNLKIGLQYVGFSEKDFAAKVNKDPALVKAYFDKNRGTFRTPEKRDLNLIVGTTADFLKSANVSDQQLHQEYNSNLDSYRIPERVKARHILIKTQGKPKEQIPALKAKAEDLLKQLQHGGDFAELAKKNSEDPGSGAKGGELGWLIRGQTVPQFEKTVFSLPAGQLSGLVETEYGYHIIQVEEKQPGHTQTFEEVKAQLMADLQKEAASDNLRRSVASARAETVKTPGQAEAIAKKYNLKFLKVEKFTSNGSLPEVNSQPELTNAIFSAAKNAVTDVTSLDTQGKAAFAVVTGIQPAHDADYAEVQADVLQKYTTTEGLRLAQEAAKAAVERAKKGESLETIAKSYDVAVKTASPFTTDGAAEGIGSGATLQSAFKANVGGIVGPVSAQDSEFVCKVTEKIPADMAQFAKNKDGIVQSLQTQKQTLATPLFRSSLVAELKRRGKIKMNQDTIQRMTGSYQS